MGRLNSSNEDLFEFTHRHVPEPSTRLSIPAWSAVRWWYAGLFSGERSCTESQRWPTPCCFALRDANAVRLQCLRSFGSVWQRAPTGSLPRKKPPQRKPRATVKHMLHKRTAGFTEQPRQPYRNPGSVFFQMKTGSRKNNKNTAALVATNVNNDTLPRVFTCSKSISTF